MKTKFAFSLLVASSLTVTSLIAGPSDGGLVVHEWGTFTSLQGGDGALVPWRPLETSRLPQFVYDWKKPGLGRMGTAMFSLGKGQITSLQRMETPVVYFYSDHEQTVDLSVKFPKGTITEWFPQATQVGPSVLVSNATDIGPLPQHTPENLIRWSHIQVLPERDHADISKSFPNDNSGLNYFTARETDADPLRIDEISKESLNPEFEKFLFYRGTGNFTTPLRVTMTAENSVTLANTGSEALPDLFVLIIKNKAGKFFQISQLGAGKEKTVEIAPKLEIASGAGFTIQIKQAMSRALVKTGLYQREADAMVATWSDSWFTEDGVRVLYLLPRAWTDGTLPMTMNPAPNKLVRVMVGRAEVLTPALERSLVEQIDKAAQGDAAAAKETDSLLKSLGRFGQPAFQRALAAAKLQPAEQMKVFALLDEAHKTN